MIVEQIASKIEKMSEAKCPHKYKFGKDYDKYNECDVCPLWEKCINFETPAWKKRKRK